jgi:uncharacterized protein
MADALIAFFICIFLGGAQVHALEIPQSPQGRVSDYAKLLSPAAIQRIESTIARHEAESSDQIAVAVFSSLEGRSLEDFSIRLADQWKIGTKEHDNGVILLIFVEDRRMRLEVGYGLEGRLTDAMSDRILRQILTPRFREGKFDQGVEDAVDAIIQVIRGEYKAPPRKEEARGSRYSALLFWVFLILFIYILAKTPRRYWQSATGSPMQGRRSGWSRRRSVPWWWGSGGGGFGGGGFGGFGGGGFGGGGGGFGGGGASGRW